MHSPRLPFRLGRPTVLPLLLIGALALAGCGGGEAGGFGAGDDGATHATQYGSVTVVNATDFPWATVRLTATNGSVSSHNVPIDGSATFTGVAYGGVTVDVFGAHGESIAGGSLTLDRSAATLTLY